MTTGDLILGAVLFLVGRKAKAAAKPAAAASAIDRIAKLQARANQPAAAAWIPDLVAAGASPGLAAALARWIGIESSGNPSKPSSKGEYGLLQIMPATAKEALTPGEWLQLKDPTTSRADQARIALKQLNWHTAKAKKWVSPWPTDTAIFYVKLHHARPADLTSVKMTGNPLADSRALIAKWKNDPAALLRLAAASVVAWNTVTP